MSSAIEARDFAPFFSDLYGYPPFPWQQRLAILVCESGRWPRQLDLPTGVGKTATIDIALFHLAYDVAKGIQRNPPLLIAFTVDRRLIVDEAYDRAKHIASRLKDANTDVLKRVAQALLSIAGQ